MKNRRHTKRIALFLAVIITNQTVFPTVAAALTGGPSQPEIQGFQPVGTSDMVDLFTGDFSYNIPLLDVDGYPLNLSYQSTPGMDEEASWVGLGWTLNPGMVNRSVRGFPDDFRDEEVKKEYNIKPDITVGVNPGANFQIFGMFGIGFMAGIYHNSYRGFGTKISVSPALTVGDPNKLSGTLGLSFSYDSQSGLDISGNIGLDNKRKAEEHLGGLSFGGFNSRQGLKELAIGLSLSRITQKATRSASGSTGLSFSKFSYFPTSQLPLANESWSLHGTIGAAFFGTHPNLKISGYYTRQYPAFKKETQKAYGFLFSEEGSANENTLLDFNIDRISAYRQDMPNLPMPLGTYDLFNVASQGVGGQYHAIRNDIGVFRNGKLVNNSVADNLGVELGAGGLFHSGFDRTVANTRSTVSLWSEDNDALSRIPFTGDDKLYEAAFFKNAAEQTVTNSGYYNQLGGDQAIRLDVVRRGATAVADRRFTKEKNMQNTGTIALSSPVKRNNREIRNQVFSYQNAAEAQAGGLEKWIYDYPVNTLVYPGCNPVNRDSFARTVHPEHHLSEINITANNGMRYVYGVPAYNKLQREVSFSINNVSASDSAFHQAADSYGLITYGASDNTVNNNKGEDHYFNAEEIPEYAHGFLLTGVLSADYADRTGNGISDDDPGTAVKINYSLHDPDYHWRAPFGTSSTSPSRRAKLQEGYKSKTGDDKASYLYGVKEIWYAHSVESRTMVAQFYLSAREDGYGVIGENGGLNVADTSMKLDSIRLYSKADLIKNGTTDAIPIKTVHFEYDYSLCPGIPNNANGEGKLTLKKVYFTYGNNRRGILNAYQFDYKGANVRYNAGHMDRWGNYKKNPTGSPDNFPNNDKYSYALQDSVLAGQYAGVWSLDEIIIPSGGKIEVAYEPDDYAYVQNVRAGQMMFLAGFANSTSDNPSSSLYTGSAINRYLAVELPYQGGSDQELIARYLDGVTPLYFNCLVNLGVSNAAEYIQGYANYNRSQVVVKTISGEKYLYIPVNLIAIRGKNYHPVTVATLQTMRLNFPEFVYPGYNNGSAGIESLIKSLVGLGNEIRNITNGFEGNSVSKNWGQTVDTNHKSWVRLANPTFKKLGGGSRVKSVVLSDEWNVTDGGGAREFGQKYSYVTDIAFNGETIQGSSGVAVYEPILGNEENLMRVPLPYEEKIPLAPSNYYYTELPIGEALFPAPSVGYSKVKVESITPGTGYSIHQFFTAKEFPIRTDYTKKDPELVKSSPILSFFKIKKKEHLSVSQGFAVEVNDMHGKPKEMATYNEFGGLISATKYHYKADTDQTEEKHLNSTVNLVDEEGSISPGELGLDVEIWQHMQQERTETEVVGVSTNLEGILIFAIFFAFPIAIPVPLPVYQNESTQLRTAVTTKFIKRSGVLDKVTVMENGSTVSTENLLFDRQTGNVLLTKTTNEFDDPIYQFTYPAHWAYEGMEQAYQNIGGVFKGITINNGLFTGGFDPEPYFVPGDVIVIKKQGEADYEDGSFYIARPDDDLVVLDASGDDFSAPAEPVDIKIIRSGRRNQAAMPIGTVSSLKEPIASNELAVEDSKDILTASAVEYNELWHIDCMVGIDTSGDNSFETGLFNPYTSGMLGNFRPSKSYAFYENRNPNAIGTTNIRIDGTIDNFVPFWDYNGTAEKFIPVSPKGDWTLSNKVTRYDTRGNEIENQNAIDVFSAADFGYNRTRAIAVASNAQNQEIFFDGFEDYQFESGCDTVVMSRKAIIVSKTDYNTFITDEVAHTGKHSLAIPVIEKDVKFNINVNDNCSSPASLMDNNGVEKASAGYYTTDDTHYYNTCEGCLPILNAIQDSTYYFSVWVATDSTLKCGAESMGADVRVEFSPASSSLDFDPEGPVIDGWQRLEAKFTVPSNAEEIIFILNIGNAAYTYFDDFRFHPWKSNMKSYVYNPDNLRLMAILDENNYATFYEYDDEGMLVRVKRETDRGIITVQEGRTVLTPNTQ